MDKKCTLENVVYETGVDDSATLTAYAHGYRYAMSARHHFHAGAYLGMLKRQALGMYDKGARAQVLKAIIARVLFPDNP